MSPIKEFARRLLTSLNYHRKGEKGDIFIFSCPRSGSTWLMELLYTQAGVKYINEPLGKNKLDYHKVLPINTRWRYASLNPFEEQVLREYLQDDKKLRLFGSVNVFHSNYSLITNRRVLKIIRANSLIEWFSTELDGHVVYLVRHPIAQSLSCIRRGHRERVVQYIQDDQFVRQYLGEDTKEFTRQILQSGSTLEKFVTQWCLSNLVPLNRLKVHNEWLGITYEELVLRPEAIVELLCDRLDLQDREKMLSRIRVPSRVTDSSTEQTKRKIEKGDLHFLVTKWRGDVSDEEEKRVFDILERFDIRAYQCGSPVAAQELLHFGPL